MDSILIMVGKMATQVEVSKHLGVSTTVIGELTARGVFEKASRGGYDLEECRLKYLRHLRDQAAGRAASGDLDLGAERARLAKEQADAKEMENAIERGDLVYIEKVAKEFETQLLKAKTKLLAMPSKIAAEVHASANVKEAKELIELNMQDALSELVGYGRQTTD